ncbi:MAG: hypothetical protein J6L60_06025 [Bacteroidaceae bacterium]|nr:hypothetical protein [Bacteroidaceae bacterium]
MKKKITSFLKSNLRSVTAAFAIAFAASGSAVTLTPISGTDGAAASEGFAALIDGKPETKWCVTNFTDAYVVFKSDVAVSPSTYYLITGGDTGKFPERNWKVWRIYGANFASDEEATRESDAWTLIDEKTNGEESLPQANTAPADFTCSETVNTTYTHFKIEVEKIISISTDTQTMQMAEFNFGHSSDLRIVSYTPLYTENQGDINGNEGASRLIDSNTTTKWGSGTIPTWIVFKTSVPIKPTYYRLVTGNDNASYTGRNWSDWEIYGANFASDEEATADAEGWVLLDDKNDIGPDVLPDQNFFSVYFTPSETIAEEYSYFKIVINSLQNAGFMQMCEFTWGDELILKKTISDSYATYKAFNLDVTAWKQLIEDYNAKLEELKNCADIFTLNDAVSVLNDLQTQINNSANAYSTYMSMVANVQKYLDEHPDMNAEGRALLESYISTNIEPNNTFMNGSYLYIMENLQLNDEEVLQEGAFITSLMEQYASDLTEGAIDVVYTTLDGTPGFSTNEDAGWLFDGTETTKWCALGSTGYVVFKTSEPIMPTFYKLVTANDTEGNPSRNWKSWKLYAANFESDEAAARDAEGWTLVDAKTNIGKDQLPAANFATAYFYLSAAPAEAYQYYKLEIEELMDGGDRFQMGEMALYNQANFYSMRQEYVEMYEGFDLDVAAQQSLIDEYNQVMRELRSAANVSTLGTASSRLAALQNEITASVEQYAAYDAQVALLVENIGDMGDNMSAFFTNYIENSVAPGDIFINGSYPYIMENRQLSTDQLKAEINYLAQSIYAGLNSALLALHGTPGFNDAEGPISLFDGKMDTKFCSPMHKDGGVYVVFKAYDVVSPYFYTLVTGGDTYSYPERNWGTWRIYGANFEGDGQAARDAEGWTLIDEKIEIGQNRLNPANNTTSYFGMSTGLVEYQYYKIEIECGYQGSFASQQMVEFSFGNEEEFQDILAGYVDAAGAFNTDVTAEQALLDQYEEAVAALDGAAEMEDLFAKNYAVEQMQEQILASAAAYDTYKAKIEGIRAYLATNPIEDSDAKAFLETYLNAESAEEGVYPNGVFATIYDEHILSAEQVMAEIEYAESLQQAAVMKGYLAGADVTVLLPNADMSKGWEHWSSNGYGYGNNGKTYAAELVNGTFDLSQTLTGLKNGVYEVTVNAGYRPSNVVSSTNYAATIYANGIHNYVQAVIEDMVPVDQAEDKVNCYLNGDIADLPVVDELGDTIGYAMHGIQSTCYAIEAGRHINKVLVLVEDGTLTVGIKDPGTGVATDWTGFGNFKLTYAGSLEEAGTALDNVLASQSARAQTLLNYATDVVEYATYPNFGNDMREVLASTIEAVGTTTDGAGKYALVEKFSECFLQIYEAKKAYLDLVNTAEKIFETWAPNTAMSEDEMSAFMSCYNGAWSGFFDGEYTLQGAKDKKAELLQLYPPYFYPKSDYEPNSIVLTETAPFTYHIESNGTDPYLGLIGLIETLPSEDYVIAFEYKSEKDITDGRVYFASPDLSSVHYNRYGTIAAANEWTPYYIDLRQAYAEWGWGKGTDHWFRWDIADEEGFVIDIRHIRIISRAEMEANGGSTAIEDVTASDKVQNGVVKGIFNLNGQRVEKAVKGLYIINGKKVLVK